MKWIIKKDISGKIKTKHQAIEMSIHHWLQLSIASLDDFEDIITKHKCIPMDGVDCGLCEFNFRNYNTCHNCPLVNDKLGDGCCLEYNAVAEHRNNLENNLTYKNKRKFQRAAKKLLIRLLQIKYKEGQYI